MDEAVTIVLVSVGAVVLVSLLWANVLEQRPKKLRAFAEEMGFTYHDNLPKMAADLQAPKSFGTHIPMTARHAMHGQAHGLLVLLCDYHYAVPFGNGARECRSTVVCLIEENANWPVFNLRPRRFRRRVDEPLGKSETDLEQDAEFNRRFQIEGPDKEALNKLLTTDVREHFIQSPGVWVEAGGPRLLITRGRTENPANLRQMLEEAFAIRSLLQTGKRPG